MYLRLSIFCFIHSVILKFTINGPASVLTLVGESGDCPSDGEIWGFWSGGAGPEIPGFRDFGGILGAGNPGISGPENPGKSGKMQRDVHKWRQGVMAEMSKLHRKIYS